MQVQVQNETVLLKRSFSCSSLGFAEYNGDSVDNYNITNTKYEHILSPMACRSTCPGWYTDSTDARMAINCKAWCLQS